MSYYDRIIQDIILYINVAAGEASLTLFSLVNFS